MGTPEFAVPSLRILLEKGYKVVGVITAPDKAAGRGKKIQESAVKKFALEKGLKVLQPNNLKDPVFLEQLRALEPDLQIVVAFRMLPESVWNLPPLGTYNLHASLLPRYRGAAPINRAIMNGETKTGITTFQLQKDIDTGNILLQEELQIPDTMNAGELHDVLMEKGAWLLLRTVQTIEEHLKQNKALPFKIQNESEVCHAPKIFKEDCKIRWSDSVLHIYNQIRGLSPYPAAYSLYEDGEGNTPLIKIYKALPHQKKTNGANGTLIDENKKSLEVICTGGTIEILELQQEGKRRMSTQDFLRGFKRNKNGKFI